MADPTSLTEASLFFDNPAGRIWHHPAGYVRLAKRRDGPGRPRTWASLTKDGRRAFAAHVAELQRLAALAVAPLD